jgi:hypothetical protein
MKFAYDVPGYVQGHRFSDAPEFFDAENEHFRDLACGDKFGNFVEKINGTPVFQSRGDRNRRGLFLDNQNHWQFSHQCPWAGSGLIVVEMNYVTSDGSSFTPYIFGDSASLAANPKISALYISSQSRLTVDGGSSVLAQTESNFPNNQIAIFAWSRNQQDRKSRITQDGTTVQESAALASNTNTGLLIGMRGQPRVRLGNLNGVDGDTAGSSTGTLRLFEQHFWKGDVLKDHLPELRGFIESLSDHYGIGS